MWWTKKKEVRFSNSDLKLIGNMLWDLAESIKTKPSKDLTIEQVIEHNGRAKSIFDLRDKILLLRYCTVTKK